jgi:acyl-CoA thioesterase-2
VTGTDHTVGGAGELTPIEDLLSVLDLRRIGSATISIQGLPGEDSTSLAESEATVFEGRSQKMPHGRVFGGQVLAQCVIAAGRTVAGVEGDRAIHSLHGYFMRPGDDTKPIKFSVERMRDGRSFSTRRVHAIQNGKAILSMIASFQSPAGGLQHQDAMPDVPGPEGLPGLSDLFGGFDHPGARHLARRPIEQRHVEGNLYAPEAGGGQHDRSPRVAAQHVWMRARAPLPDDPLIHAAVLAYASDYSLLEPVIRRHGLTWQDPRLRPASLDHAMWFHRAARLDQWMLYSQQSPSAQGGRGLGIGRMFTADGDLAATIAQEGMVRLKE